MASNANKDSGNNNGLYLNLILGSDLNLVLQNDDAKYRYKKGYENFKIKVTYVILSMFILALLFPSRPLDAVCNFLLVWYYCTLTIREAILRVNGSRIKGWWVFHHYISCFLCGVNLTWTTSECYDNIRVTFIWLVIWIGIVQFVQTRYQLGCLRRLYSLGKRHHMDITLEGFTSWMFKGLTFLLPFLILCYVFQAYCAYALFHMYFVGGCSEWQALVLACVFTFLALGNIIATLIVVGSRFLGLSQGSTTKKPATPEVINRSE